MNSNSYDISKEVRNSHHMQRMNMTIGSEDENSNNQTQYEEADEDNESGKYKPSSERSWMLLN